MLQQPITGQEIRVNCTLSSLAGRESQYLNGVWLTSLVQTSEPLNPLPCQTQNNSAQEMYLYNIKLLLDNTNTTTTYYHTTSKKKFTATVYEVQIHIKIKMYTPTKYTTKRLSWLLTHSNNIVKHSFLQ
jgi:hypothetical protein